MHHALLETSGIDENGDDNQLVASSRVRNAVRLCDTGRVLMFFDGHGDAHGWPGESWWACRLGVRHLPVAAAKRQDGREHTQPRPAAGGVDVEPRTTSSVG